MWKGGLKANIRWGVERENSKQVVNNKVREGVGKRWASGEVSTYRRNFYINENEKRVLFFLREYIRESNSPHIGLRVVGSWVRNKILEKETEETVMKVAVENVKVTEFCQTLFRYYRQRALLLSSGYKILSIRKAPPHSGGLASDMVVASVHRNNVELVSMVSLSGKALGSPMEHAFAQDLTINSLYYNVLTDRIEDYTHLGMKDVRNMILRSPMPAEKGLLMDSVRAVLVTRLLSVHKDYSIDGELLDALHSKAVHDDLKAQIERVRIMEEIKKLYGKYNNMEGIEVFLETGIHSCVFYSPEVQWTSRSSHLAASLVYSIANGLLKETEMEGERLLSLFAASIAPLVLIYRNQKFEFEINPFNAITEYMTVPSVMKKQLRAVLESVPLFFEFFPLHLWKEDRVPSVPMLTRYWDHVIDKFANWFQSLYVADNASFSWKTAVILSVELSNSLVHPNLFLPRAEIIESIERMGIPHMSTYQPILNGHEISKLVGVKGETLGLISRYLFRWQLFKNTNPSVSSARQFVIDLTNGMKKLNLIPAKDMISNTTTTTTTNKAERAPR